MAYSVSHHLAQTAFVSRVSSLATSRLLVASDDLGIDARQLVVDGRPVTDPYLTGLALSDSLWRRALVSPNGRVGAIVVELSSTDTPALRSVMEEIERVLTPYRDHGFRFHLVGEAVMWAAVQQDAFSSALRVAIGTGGLLFFTLLFLIRSIWAVSAILLAIGGAVICTLGVIPVFGWHQSELTSAAAAVILVIGCADSVHFVAQFLGSRSGFANDHTALAAASREVQAPCALTTATTAGSFLSFTAGGVHSLVQFGVLAAIGVSLAFLLTFSLLPALLALLPPNVRSERLAAAWREVLGRLASFGVRRKGLVVLSAVALAAVGAAGIPKLHVELNPYELWSADHPIRRSLAVVSENLQKPDRVEIEIGLPPGWAIEDEGALSKLAELETLLLQEEGLGEIRSVLTVLRHANRLIHPEMSEATPLPRSAPALGELLALIDAGDAGALDSWVTIDHKNFRLSAESQDLSLVEKQRLVARIEHRLRGSMPHGWTFQITGPVALLSRYGSEFGRSQLSIISASTAIVFLLIWAYLRSFSWAVLATIPNAVALLVFFGVMGHWGINQDAGSAIVAPIAIGIAADDTIHFLTAYARERGSGFDPVASLLRAISSVGEAVLITATALALGFLSMMASPFSSAGNIGLLSAIAIIAATLADLLILPALIATVAGWRGFGSLPKRHG
jgi:hypothetical protein